VQNLLHGHKFDLHENEPVGGTHFQMNDFARRLVLTQRQKRTLKWVGKVPFFENKVHIGKPLANAFRGAKAMELFE